MYTLGTHPDALWKGPGAAGEAVGEDGGCRPLSPTQPQMQSPHLNEEGGQGDLQRYLERKMLHLLSNVRNTTCLELMRSMGML